MTERDDRSYPLIVNGEQLRQRLDRSVVRRRVDSYFPYSYDETVERLIPQLVHIREQIDERPPELFGTNPVIEAQLLPQFLAASRFPRALFQAAGLVPVGTRNAQGTRVERSGVIVEDQPTKSVYLAATADIAELELLLARPASRVSTAQREALQAIEGLRLASATVLEQPSGAATPWETVLHGSIGPSGALVPADLTTRAAWSSLIREAGGIVHDEWIRQSGSLTYIPVDLPESALGRVSQFNSLRAIHPIPRIRYLPAATTDETIFPMPIQAEKAPAGGHLRVAVFDGGIDDTSPAWAGRVTNMVVGTPTADAAVQRHGALVTSALLYGHIEANRLPDAANMTIAHYQCVPQHGHDDDFEMYWLLDLIEKQVSLNNYDIVVICVAPNMLLDDDNVDRWTSTIDTLSHQQGVLFLVAAGNNGEDDATAGFNRVLVPADAANVIAVGAADQVKPKAKRASYSAVGPGRVSTQQRPTGVAFGGTRDNPFFATDNDGIRLEFHGTSCAAPTVAYGLADLATRLGRTRISATVLRAFAIHFADPCARGELKTDVGFGHFRADYPMITDGAANAVHILYRGSIARSEFIPLALPVPEGIPAPIQVRYTLATSTAIAAHDPVDYTLAGLEVRFRPDLNVVRMRKDGNPTVVVNTRKEPKKAAQMFADGYQASDPVTINIEKRPKYEANLRAEGKWDSIRNGVHKFTKTDALYLPRLELTHLAREDGILVSDVPDLDWALIVTLQAGSGINLHEQVLAEFPVLNTLAVPAGRVTVQAG